ncbi:MAG: NAD-dependent epimerase/dehydratase family protein [Verrucomicrobiota bacterium]
MAGTVLVTGAAGFIASRVCRLLLDDGFFVVGVDNYCDAYDVRLKRHRLDQFLEEDRFSFHEVDIEDRGGLRSLFEANSFDAILNLAARAGVRYSMENPYIYLSSNGMGTLNVLELMREFGVKKHVLSSTSSLYAGQPMPYVETAPVNEPISPYAASKKAAEVMTYTYHHLHGIDSTVVRYFTVYGPASRPDMAMLRFIRWIDEGIPITMYGDGEQSRDFTYVDDIARGTIAAMKPVGYEIINLGGGKQPVTMNLIISELEKRLGKKAEVDYQEAHIADMRETWADIQKAKDLLGWGPTISLEEGLDQTVQWHRDHRDLALSLDL